MKKVMQTIAVIAMLLSPLALGGNALAASTCQVGYTGPNSDNLCVATTTYQCNVVDNTIVDIVGQNTQISLSGNSNGGSASTGTATNTNGVTFTATVRNQACTVVATVPATPVTPAAQPVAPTPAVTAPQKVTAAALPNTDSGSPLVAAAIATSALGAGAVLVRLATSAYVRIKA